MIETVGGRTSLSIWELDNPMIFFASIIIRCALCSIVSVSAHRQRQLLSLYHLSVLYMPEQIVAAVGAQSASACDVTLTLEENAPEVGRRRTIHDGCRFCGGCCCPCDPSRFAEQQLARFTQSCPRLRPSS
jgi:hypothetical protein